MGEVVETDRGAARESIGEKARSGPVKAARRRRMVLDLRAAGLTHADISEQMTRAGEPITPHGVASTLRRALNKMAEETSEAAETAREMELHRINLALQVLVPKVRDGNLKAMREYRAFIDQRAKLLGLYAPTKHEHSGQVNHTLSTDEREEVLRLEEAFVTSTAEDDGSFTLGPGDLPDAEVVTG